MARESKRNRTRDGLSKAQPPEAAAAIGLRQAALRPKATKMNWTASAASDARFRNWFERKELGEPALTTLAADLLGHVEAGFSVPGMKIGSY